MNEGKVRETLLMRSALIPWTGCRLWEGGGSSAGYGQLRVDGKTQFVHRLAYSLFKAPIPAGLHVLHQCDVRCCLNPDHLFVGTNTDNIRDSMAKNRRKGVTRRRPKGIRFKCREGAHDMKLKIPRSEWPAIAARLTAGEQQSTIAVEFDVHQSTISHIRSRLKCV